MRFPGGKPHALFLKACQAIGGCGDLIVESGGAILPN